MTTTPPGSVIITEHEVEAIVRANRSGRQPVVFVHGLWLLPSSWERWAQMFETAGYTALMPGWPDDPETVEAAKADPGVFANKTIAQVCDHFEQIISGLDRKPAVVGHSFGGMFAQMLAGRGRSVATVSISPAPFQGVLPLPFSALKSAWPVLGNPLNKGRAVPLTFEQFHYAFANAVDEAEARTLYDTYAVAAPGEPLFQSAAANLNPWTEAKVDHERADRGPMLVVGGAKDHTVPMAIVQAAFDQQRKNPGVTEIVEMPGRGHSLTIDHGWQEVAQASLSFIGRFAAPGGGS